MGLFWNYFRKTLRFPLIWKAGPIGVLVEGGAKCLDMAREAILWLRDQFLPTKAETQYLEEFAVSRGLRRFPDEAEINWHNRIKFAYRFWKKGGKLSGITEIFEIFGFTDVEIVELTAPTWAQDDIVLTLFDGAPYAKYLFWAFNEVKPARSKLRDLITVSKPQSASLGAGVAMVTHIQC